MDGSGFLLLLGNIAFVGSIIVGLVIAAVLVGANR